MRFGSFVLREGIVVMMAIHSFIQSTTISCLEMLREKAHTVFFY